MTATKTFFAAINTRDDDSAVYGIGATPEAALADARRLESSGSYRAVACSASAAAYVEKHGGAPEPELCVGSRPGTWGYEHDVSVWLHSEEEG